MSEDVERLVVTARNQSVDPEERHAAFEGLVLKFQDMAYGCAFGVLGDFHLAEDVAQDAFLAAYSDLQKLSEPAAFPGWFKHIVLRKAYRLSKVHREPLESMEISLPASAEGPSQPEQLEDREEQADYGSCSPDMRDACYVNKPSKWPSPQNPSLLLSRAPLNRVAARRDVVLSL